MAHIGRTVKNVEAPRPLKSQSRSSLKNNFMLIEELIQLIENVALTLQAGINNTEPMASLVQNLRIHGPQLESVSKDTLDRAFVVFRNASQDERLNIMTRLNLLELIELRAKGWEDNGINSYYKTKQVTNVEMPVDTHHHHQTDASQAAFLSTSPTFGAGSAAMAAAMAVGTAQQQLLLLGPGELIRNSGKFPKPTKIPGKTYCKDEVVIRNADSGKVMGIKGRRVHMIEELSETIISFQRVNPGAKERLVQITGPTEEKINYAKQLIEDTIRRNASPVRLDPAMGAHTGGSCSSLASSNSDEATPRAGGGGGNNLANRLSLNSAQNFMTATAAAQQVSAQQQAAVAALMASSTPNAVNAATAAAAGEYKYTVNVGQHLIKITGDCCDLVRVAKLVLDDYFSSAEFLASVEAGAAFDGSMVSPIGTPSTPMGQPQFMMGTPLQMAPPMADSGIGLNYMANNVNDGDDDVFIDANGLASSQNNGLARSRRSHFSRKDTTPEAATSNATPRSKSESANASGNANTDSTRVVHEYEHLLYYAKSPHSWALPVEWQKICEKFPSIVRNKVKNASTNSMLVFRVASNTTSTTTTTSNNSNIISSLITPHTASAKFSTNSSTSQLLGDKFSTMQLNIKRKGFFNRQTYSIDEEALSTNIVQLQKQMPMNPEISQNNSPAVAEDTTLEIQSSQINYNNNYSNNNNNVSNIATAPPKEINSGKHLLDKQIKIISAIMENSGKKIESSELINQDPILILDSDDENGKVDNISSLNVRDNVNKSNLNHVSSGDSKREYREYRSNSTCD